MKPKRVPRLWCALQGLLPLDACLAAQRGELAWPPERAGSCAVAPVESESANPSAGKTHSEARRCKQ